MAANRSRVDLLVCLGPGKEKSSRIWEDLRMYRSYKGNDYVDSPLVGGAFSFFVCLYYIVGIRRFEFQSMIEKLLNIEHIFLVVVAGQLIVGMLGKIILVG